MTDLNSVLMNILYNAGMYITGVCSVTSITIRPGAVVEGEEFSIQCTYDVPLYHLAIRRTAVGDRIGAGIKVAEYLHDPGLAVVHRTLRDRATFYPGNTTLVIRNAHSSMDAAWYRCEVYTTADAGSRSEYSDILGLQVYGRDIDFAFPLLLYLPDYI